MAMPQLVKGGKFVYGWAQVGADGRVPIPDQAREEYGLGPRDSVYVIPGSRTSGGFSLVKTERLIDSPIGRMIERDQRLVELSIPPGEVVDLGDRIICWVELETEGGIILSEDAMARYGVAPGDSLVVVRGSGLGPGFVVRGPLVEEARRHPELIIY